MGAAVFGDHELTLDDDQLFIDGYRSVIEGVDVQRSLVMIMQVDGPGDVVSLPSALYLGLLGSVSADRAGLECAQAAFSRQTFAEESTEVVERGMYVRLSKSLLCAYSRHAEFAGLCDTSASSDVLRSTRMGLFTESLMHRGQYLVLPICMMCWASVEMESEHLERYGAGSGPFLYPMRKEG